MGDPRLGGGECREDCGRTHTRTHVPVCTHPRVHMRTHTTERVELLSPEESAMKGSWSDRCGGQGLGRESLCSWEWSTGHLDGPLAVAEELRDTFLLIQRHTVSIW